MARGDFLTFEEFRKSMADGSHDLDGDSFSVILITTLPNIADATPDSADYTEVAAGGGYSTGGITMTTTYTESAGVATFADSAAKVWTAAAGSPTDIVAGLVINTTHAGTTDAVGFVDMTVDGGGTPISLVDGNVTIEWNGSTNLFTVS
jgi:hypothetical protein